jgi:hypothetical protein
MEVALTTNLPGAGLTLRQVKRFADGSGYATDVGIDSYPFAASFPFSFEPFSLEQFVTELRDLDRTLNGAATLKPMWEASFIRLAGNGRGAIAVSGDLLWNDQQLRFEFMTDQTCLRPLITDLARLPLIPAV